jgi:hypothetical protein
VDGFVERTLDGREVHTWRAGGSPTNQHDFQLLPNGHALVLTYRERDHVNLRRWGGPADAAVLDGEVQEVDRGGEVRWAWNTKDHIKLGEAGRWLSKIAVNPKLHKADGTPLYDVMHLNSIDPVGNVLAMSFRYTDSAYGIDRSTGHVLWKVGGTHTDRSLSIQSDPEASADFGGQHDARLSDDGRLLTVYDNGTRRSRLPRALGYRLDLTNRTAKLRQAIEYPPAGGSECCGSARVLPGGNWVMSWGNTRWFTEQRPSGHLVLAIEWAVELRTYRAIPLMRDQLSRAALNSAMSAMAP